MASEEPVYYRVHSMVRRVQTRSLRQRAVGRHRFVQRLGGGEITVRRARATTISSAQIAKHHAELLAAVEDGRLEVRSLRGEVIDLRTMKGMAPKKTASPKPTPKLDSAADDKTFEHGVGEHKPMHPGGTPEGLEAPSPTVTPSLTGEEDKPVKTTGDPAKARASEKKGKGKKGKSK